MKKIIITTEEGLEGMRPHALNIITNYEMAVTPTSSVGISHGLYFDFMGADGKGYNVYVYHTNNAIIANCRRIISIDCITDQAVETNKQNENGI
jgi:hypothetical protein